jgi:hypothetical protein
MENPKGLYVSISNSIVFSFLLNKKDDDDDPIYSVLSSVILLFYSL